MVRTATAVKCLGFGTGHPAPGGRRKGSPSLCSPSIRHFPDTGHETEGTWVRKVQSLPEQWYSQGTLGPVGSFHPNGVPTPALALATEGPLS